MKSLSLLVLTALAFAIVPFSARAASFYVRDTRVQAGISVEDARTVTSLVRNAVSSRSGDELALDPSGSDYELQPQIMKLGESFLFTVEKIRGQQVLFAAQSKLERLDQLDVASRTATNAAIEEPSLPKRPAIRASSPQPDVHLSSSTDLREWNDDGTSAGRRRRAAGRHSNSDTDASPRPQNRLLDRRLRTFHST